jgi:hypothetical protein
MNKATITENKERYEFLEKKPTYSCRFHPTNFWHEVGCSHVSWSNEELQGALDNAKRSLELQLHDFNTRKTLE